MITIKIISNPYNRNISYQVYKSTGTWEDISQDSINSRLRENDAEKIFLPFKVKEIIDTIIKEYYVGNEPIQLIFEGTTDEFEELVDVCNEESVKDKIHLVRSVRILENARDILDHTKKIFDTVHPIVKSIIKGDPEISQGLLKVSDALEDIIEAANGKPVLVAYWFKHDLERIKERLHKLHIPFSTMDSSDSIWKWNSGELSVALIHPASAGHGLNLQSGGSCLVWFGLTWSLELYQQTNARLWRQGQKAETVVIQHIVAKGTIDERILKALQEKDRQQTALMDAVKAELEESHGRII